MDLKKLRLLVNDNRKKIIEMIYEANVGHVGGSLSVIDVLTCIYELEISFNNKERSKVVLSKGHAVPAMYVNLYNKGIIKREDFKTFRQINSKLQGHPATISIKEVDATTGLLGQGFSLALGMGIAKRHKKDNNFVYAIAGDGEMQEGQMWEALLFAAHLNVNNVIFIIDYNKLSSSSLTNEVINIEPLIDKLKSFNLNVISIDGHNVFEIVNAINEAKLCKSKPSIIIANTVKGKGVSFMEMVGKWHSGGITNDEYLKAMSDLNEIERNIHNEL